MFKHHNFFTLVLQNLIYIEALYTYIVYIDTKGYTALKLDINVALLNITSGPVLRVLVFTSCLGILLYYMKITLKLLICRMSLTSLYDYLTISFISSHSHNFVVKII